MNELNPNYKTAVETDTQIKQSALNAQQNLYDMAMGFKKMRDEKLYTALGYENFGEYCEKGTGFKRAQVYNYISVVENLPEDFVYSSRQIGIKKLTLLTQLSDEERTQITENTDLESTTVKELKAQIDSVKKQNDILKNERDRALKSNEDASHQVFMADKKVLEMKNKVSELEKQLKDKPIEIVSNSEEEEKLKSQIDELKRENEKISDDAEKIKADYEKALAEKSKEETIPDDKETFRLYLSTAVDSIKRLCEYVKKNTDSNNYGLYREKSVQLSDIIRKELEG